MDGITSILLGLTAGERWAAARRMSPQSVPQQWLVLLGVAVLLVLLVLLFAVSVRRRQQSRGQRVEKFDMEALRKGLTTRERQILLAIALRSGLRRKADIFHAVDAFNRGAAQLFAEFARTRTPQANTELKAEAVRLRAKLYPQAAFGGPIARERPSSRDIPVDKWIELTEGKEHAAVTIRSQVLRHDGMELVVALETPVPSKAGDPWLARYYSGATVWEFRTSTVRCDGRKLTLKHSDEIHFTNRRRFPRTPVRAGALTAHLPLLRSARVAAEGVSPSAEGPEAAGAHLTGGGGLEFVESTVTELAGPGLRLETRLPVQVDERILVLVQLTQGRDGAAARHTLAAVGRVRHSQSIERRTGIPDAIDRVWNGAPQRETAALAAQPLLIGVELIGLNDEEIDTLVSLTGELSSLAPDHDVNRARGPQEAPTYTTAS